MMMMTMITMLMMSHNTNSNGEYWAIGGPKLPGPPGDPDYQMKRYR